MQLDDHVHQVHDQLRSAAALGDDRTREIAESLAATAASAVRLAIMSALSEATAEITSAILDSPGTGAPTVSLRVDGDELNLVITRLPDEPTAPPRQDEGDASARISLRLSEGLKNDIDTAADRDGVSVNTWLVRAANAALHSGPGGNQRPGRNAHRITGWVTG